MLRAQVSRVLPRSRQSAGESLETSSRIHRARGTDDLCTVCEMIERQRIDNASPRRLPFNVHLLFGSFHANQIVDDAVPVAIADGGGETTPWR
jgi:hypothetical protein